MCPVLRVAFVCAMVVASHLTPAVAADNPNPIGRPKQFTQGKGRMYAVWFEDGIWNLRTTSKEDKGKTPFNGSVAVDGDKIIGDLSSLERAKKPGKADYVLVNGTRTGLAFQFATFGATDGIQFKVGPKAKTITFNLNSGGDDDPKIIFIGAKGMHPDKGKFTLPAHPDK